VDKVKAYVKENNILYAVPFDTEFRNGTANSRIPVSWPILWKDYPVRSVTINISSLEGPILAVLDGEKWKAERSPDPCASHSFCFRCWASRSASSTIVSVGLAMPPFGKTLLPAM